MNQLKEIYNLKNDHDRIKLIQDASADPSRRIGLKIENGLLFGTKEWFNAIDSGIIETHNENGIISKVYLSGHNDYPEFELENNGITTTWTRVGVDDAYVVGKNVEVVFVEQKLKDGHIGKSVITVRISL